MSRSRWYMQDDEKNAWISTLWAWSILTVFALGGALAGSEFFLRGLILSGPIFVVLAFIWLFRVTYLKGRNSR